MDAADQTTMPKYPPKLKKMIFERSEISRNRRLWIFWSFDENRMSHFKRKDFSETYWS
jgi:hypothetical protein